MKAARGARVRGQATVESALTLPLAVFLGLSLLQMTLAMQARLATDYAVYRAARAGALARADCVEMQDAALAAVLPFALPGVRAHNPQDVVQRWNALRGSTSVTRNRYRGLGDQVPVVEIRRYALLGSASPGSFDRPLSPSEDPQLLSVELRFWFELEIPFANWVIHDAWRAMAFGAALARTDPLAPASPEHLQPSRASGSSADRAVVDAGLGRGRYFLPIVSTFTLPMMSPPRAGAASDQEQTCPP